MAPLSRPLLHSIGSRVRRAARARARRSLPVALFASACGVFAGHASAQILFSVDYRGPTIGTPVPCAPGLITAGDILSVRPPFVCGADVPIYGPVPPPDVVIPGGPFALGLGVPTIGGCVGVGPGVPCPAELDALSMGQEPFLVRGILPAGTFVFSVDEWAVGRPGSPLAPNVLSEAGVFDSAGDVFEAGVIPAYPMPLPAFPPAPVPGNTGLVDGNGLVSPTGAHYPGLGILEPRPAFAGAGARPGDNLDALDMDTVGPTTGVFFSLDAAFFDPNFGVPNLGSAAANGFPAAAVLATLVPGGPPVVYIPPLALGLDLAGPGTDDLDALAFAENGVAGYQAAVAPYAWGPGIADMVVFSVRRNSAVVGVIASGPIALPISEGDLLIPPTGAGLPPRIFVPAEYLGLATVRSGALRNDELDALDIRRPPATAIAFCHGDGDVIACPCGNNGTPGNGCANSAFASGASLSATGVASVASDSVSLNAANMTGSIAIFFQGATQLPPFVVDDGIGCVGGPVVRLGAKVVAAGSASYPSTTDPSVSVRGGVPAVGGTFFYQTFYRNAVATFCPPATSNRTNGLMILWAP